jgi:hypothetical protein
MVTDANWMTERIVKLGIVLGVTAEVHTIAQEVLDRDDQLGPADLPVVVDFVSRLVTEPEGTDALWRWVNGGSPIEGPPGPTTPDEEIGVRAGDVIYAAFNP